MGVFCGEGERHASLRKNICVLYLITTSYFTLIVYRLELLVRLRVFAVPFLLYTSKLLENSILSLCQTVADKNTNNDFLILEVGRSRSQSIWLATIIRKAVKLEVGGSRSVSGVWRISSPTHPDMRAFS